MITKGAFRGWPTALARLSGTTIRKNKRHLRKRRLFFRIVVSL